MTIIIWETYSFGDYGNNNYDDDTLQAQRVVMASYLYAIEDPKDIFDTVPIPAYTTKRTQCRRKMPRTMNATDNNQLVWLANHDGQFRVQAMRHP